MSWSKCLASNRLICQHANSFKKRSLACNWSKVCFIPLYMYINYQLVFFLYSAKQTSFAPNLQMGLTSFSTSHMLSNSFPLISQPRYLYNPLINLKSNINSCRSSPTLYVSNVAHSYQVYYKSYFSKQRGSSLVAFGAKDSGSNHEDHRALEAVLRLYTAIENRNLNELSDVIAEECRCVCNFFSAFQSFNGKKVRWRTQLHILNIFNLLLPFCYFSWVPFN